MLLVDIFILELVLPEVTELGVDILELLGTKHDDTDLVSSVAVVTVAALTASSNMFLLSLIFFLHFLDRLGLVLGRTF
jgi:hypothetical protein